MKVRALYALALAVLVSATVFGQTKPKPQPNSTGGLQPVTSSPGHPKKKHRHHSSKKHRVRNGKSGWHIESGTGGLLPVTGPQGGGAYVVPLFFVNWPNENRVIEYGDQCFKAYQVKATEQLSEELDLNDSVNANETVRISAFYQEVHGQQTSGDIPVGPVWQSLDVKSEVDGTNDNILHWWSKRAPGFVPGHNYYVMLMVGPRGGFNTAVSSHLFMYKCVTNYQPIGHLPSCPAGLREH